ncbi:F-box protein At5g07610-like [Rutidosis leptorrhynchoides]|uniref:F-box protein At5g07610-like n=1 Tax=Rutidosis leptorrhynchoides TaxID=125765 RepID=UPI003A9A266D
MMNTEAKFNLPNKSVDGDDDRNSIADYYNHQSVELIGHNVDVLTKILVGLPAKSILRFKSVSKQWLSLLTHPRFTFTFDKLSRSSGLYYHELHVSFDVTSPTTPPFRSLDSCSDTDIRIVQSCNGLLLCRYDKYHECNGYYYVFNPTTKKFASIPPVIGSPDAEILIRFMGLAYHPTECVHYKLVCILRAGHSKLDQGYDEDMNRIYGVYWNGAFHWAPYCRNPMYLRLDSEQLQDFPLPSTLPVLRYGYCRKRPLYFGESHGHLHLVDTIDENNPSSLNVYEMLKDHSGWFIKYQLDFHELFATYPNMTLTYRMFYGDKFEFIVLDVIRGEEDEDTFMVVKVVDNIKRYNILDKSFKQLCEIPDNIEEVKKYFSKAFSKTFHRCVGHRYIEKIGSF